VNDYLRGRQVLKRALVLIDSRHGIKDVDTDVMDMLDAAAVSYRIILTKADKIKASALAEVTQKTAEDVRKRPAAHAAGCCKLRQSHGRAGRQRKHEHRGL
jgi:GTP-binding protein